MSPLLASALVVFFEGLSFGVMLPVLSGFTEELGGNESLAGVMFALTTLPRVVFAPLWGRASDRFGRRKVLGAVTCGTITGSVLWAVARPIGASLGSPLMMLFASRAVYGVFAAQSVLGLAVASDVSKPEKRAAAMGVLGAAFGLAFTVGPLLGGWWSVRFSPDAVGYLAAGSQFASLLVIVLLLRETRFAGGAGGDGTAAVRPAGLLRVAARPLITVLLALTVIGTAAYSVLMPTFEPITEAWFGWDEFRAGVALSVFGLVGAIVQGGVIRPLVKRLGEKMVAGIGLVVLCAGMSWIGMHPGVGGFWTAMILAAIGTGLSVPAITAMISLACGEEDQGVAHGLNQSATSVGRATGYVIGGALFAGVGPAAAYAAGGVSAALGVAMVLCVWAVFGGAKRKQIAVDESAAESV